MNRPPFTCGRCKREVWIMMDDICQNCQQELKRQNEGKVKVDIEDLIDFRRLLLTCSKHLKEQEESLATECEQVAEMIEGYYLPYPERDKLPGEI